MKSNPLVSIIIPTKNSEETLEECLQSIKNQGYPRIEIIVVDNNSKDKTVEIAKRYTKFVFNKGPERSAQRNFGASKAKGKYLLFVDSDMVLTKNVVNECVKKEMNNKNYKAIVIPEESFGVGFWAKCKKLERSFYLGIDWIEAARFFSKSTFRDLHGYDEKQTGTEDFDLPQRLKEKFGTKSIGRVKSIIMHNEGKLGLFKVLSKKYYYSKTANRYLFSNSKYFNKQANILERYKLFFSNPKKLFENPLVGLGMLFMKTAEFAAGGLGYFISAF